MAMDENNCLSASIKINGFVCAHLFCVNDTDTHTHNLGCLSSFEV